MRAKHFVNGAKDLRARAALLTAGLLVAVAGLSTGTPAVAQIATTKHNLGSEGAGPNTFSGTAEICVFCHTPHGADTSAAVPLWNRTLPAPTAFTTYDSLGTSSLDGAVVPVGSVSIACLSCHDGTTAMNSIINAPGSGLSNEAWTGGTWTGSDRITGIANIGAGAEAGDLRNDHPIGIQYGGGGITVGSPTNATTDPDFKAPANATLNNSLVWWVDTEATPNNSRQKTDMVLYTRAAAGGTADAGDAEPFVECASCHDPHTAENPTFLRISNAGSAVCLACHVK
jgi:predicted CXXCH cytochrome family protein